MSQPVPKSAVYGVMKMPAFNWQQSTFFSISLAFKVIHLSDNPYCDQIVTDTSSPKPFGYLTPPLSPRPQGSWMGTLMKMGYTPQLGPNRNSKLGILPVLYTQGMYNAIIQNYATRIQYQTGSLTAICYNPASPSWPNPIITTTYKQLGSEVDSYDPNGPTPPNFWDGSDTSDFPNLIGIIRLPKNFYWGKPLFNTSLMKVISLDLNLGLPNGQNDYVSFGQNNASWLDAHNIILATRPQITTWPGGGIIPTQFSFPDTMVLDPNSFIAGKIYEVTQVDLGLGMAEEFGGSFVSTFNFDVSSQQLAYPCFAKRRVRSIYYTNDITTRDDLVQSASSQLANYGFAPVDNKGRVDFVNNPPVTLAWLNSLVPDMKQFFNIKD